MRRASVKRELSTVAALLAGGEAWEVSLRLDRSIGTETAKRLAAEEEEVPGHADRGEPHDVDDIETLWQCSKTNTVQPWIRFAGAYSIKDKGNFRSTKLRRLVRPLGGGELEAVQGLWR